MVEKSEDDGREILAQSEDYIDLTVGIVETVIADGRSILEEDYRVYGEVWRVDGK